MELTRSRTFWIFSLIFIFSNNIKMTVGEDPIDSGSEPSSDVVAVKGHRENLIDFMDRLRSIWVYSNLASTNLAPFPNLNSSQNVPPEQSIKLMLDETQSLPGNHLVQQKGRSCKRHPQKRDFKVISSSTHTTLIAGNAIDDDTGTKKYFHSLQEIRPWLLIDMGAPYLVSAIRVILNPANYKHFKDIKVYVTDAIHLNGNYTSSPLLLTMDGQPSVADLTLEAPGKPLCGRIVVIQTSGASKAYLIFLEIYILT